MSFKSGYLTIAGKTNSCKVIEKLEQLKTEPASPIVFYGAGEMGKRLLDITGELGITVDAVCDKNRAGQSFGKNGEFQILSPRELEEQYHHAYVLICSVGKNQEIHDDLLRNGHPEEKLIPCPVRHNAFSTSDTIEPHLPDYEWAYDLFQDQKSKQLVLDRLALFLLDEDMHINTDSECYYEKGIISLGGHEVFADCGAFVGDSAEAFIRQVSGRYEHIYSFEPDEKNCALAVDRLKMNRNVSVVNKGVWDEETILHFQHDTMEPAGSKVTDGGEVQIPVTSLDAFFAQRPGAKLPTFIKMDIEGSEKWALEGAKGIIRKMKPQLAICAYHKIDDLYVLPRTILGIRDDYRFFLRQHEEGEYDTILYAV